MLFSIGDPVVIPTTRLIRKRSPIICKQGDQAAHLLGLNIMKELFNFYATKRHVSIDDNVIDRLIVIINDKSNFACESPEENLNDKYTEAEILDLLFNGTRTYEQMSMPAKEMFLLLRQLLADLLHEMPDSGELRLIRDEVEDGVFPLHNNASLILDRHYDDSNTLSFKCPDLDDGERLSTDVLVGMKLVDARLFIKNHRVYSPNEPRYRVTQIQDPRKQSTKDIRRSCGRVRIHVKIDTNEVITHIARQVG